MKIPITHLSLISYNACHKGIFCPISFGFLDIHEAIENRQCELRSFQECIKDLQAEWDSVSLESSVELQKQYHVNRIATIIGKGIWREPLLLYVDRKSILDGQHRLWALRYLDKKEVEVIVIERNALTVSERDALWQAIAQFCGDSRRALERLKIGIIEE